MVLDDLNEGKFVIQDGVVSTLTPLTTIENIEKEMKKEIEANLTKNSGKEIILKLLGSAIEFFTENRWKIHFIDERSDNFSLLIGAPFEGGRLKGKGEDFNKSYQLYIPNGYLCMDIKIHDFPNIKAEIMLLPNFGNLTLKDLAKYDTAYSGIHPHCFTNGRLCCGLALPYKFDLNLIVSQIQACIVGSAKTKGTSIWDYNRDSPAQELDTCDRGRKASRLHKEKKSDDEIWRKLVK